AVLGGDIVQVVGGTESAGGRHVLWHDRRIARNVVAEVSRDRARINVVAAADRSRDDEADLLALVEIGDCIGAGKGREQGRQHRGESKRGKTCGGHEGLLRQTYPRNFSICLGTSRTSITGNQAVAKPSPNVDVGDLL